MIVFSSLKDVPDMTKQIQGSKQQNWSTVREIELALSPIDGIATTGVGMSSSS
jgi:hypothetical protein